jgi:hypothetical protein
VIDFAGIDLAVIDPVCSTEAWSIFERRAHANSTSSPDRRHDTPLDNISDLG